MNAVLIASKQRKKYYDGIIKEMMDFSIVSNIQIAKSSEVNSIEELNPHCVIIDYSCKFKDIDIDGFLCLLRLKCSNLRIIFNFGKVEDINDIKFNDILSILKNQKVYDVIMDDSRINAVLENPMQYGEIASQIEEIKKAKEKIQITVSEEKEIQKLKGEDVELDFHALTRKHDFNIDLITEIMDDGEPKKNNSLTIGIMELQHHLGSTRISFELAKFLYTKAHNPCVVMSDDVTYKNMLMYYRFKSTAATEGFVLDNIHILPISELETAQSIYTHVIVDIGLFKPEYENIYRKSDIKLMMCSAAEWDLIHTSRWINYPKYDYTLSINYIFVSTQQRYVQLNKSLLKGNVVSYRIDYNDDSFNKKVYDHIMRRYDLSKPNALKKRKLLKLR